ncbi:nitroreductase family protein [Nocardiopsis sp. SBT366]|uniref:nitroreductase family protein n=1 Tax=Nocardiopsis sp. SBT366 TaxID=1580529 RepID=UPI00066C3D3F|nr:nitroreductase family protein [Nocardiopsis sp. SBT366]
MAVAVEEPGSSAESRASQALHVLNTRTVVRSFSDRPVEDDLLNPLLDAMLAAPSASNKQAWAFVAVRRTRTLKLVHAFSPGIIERPPLVVAACFDRSRAVGGGAWDEGMLCVAMAVQNLLLAAHALGLGACPSASFRKGPVSRFLGLPDYLLPLLLVSIGHPDRTPETAPRRGRNEVISHECWGQ